MPIGPPFPSAPPRFEPVYLDEGDLEDLATFTGLPKDTCLARVRAYSPREMADAWRRAAPKAREEILAFYANTDLYIWELMQWHASRERWPHWRILQTLVERFPPAGGYRRVLDFGCGIGTDGLYLATQGYEVTLMDVDGLTFRFAQHRFARRGLPARFIPSQSILPALTDVYDIALSFDVFEHLPDPLMAARRIVHALRPGGILVQTTSFWHDDNYPHHLLDGARRFNGLRWHIAMAGLGLRSEGPAYRRVGGIQLLVQKFRYLLWRITGVWVTYAGRS